MIFLGKLFATVAVGAVPITVVATTTSVFSTSMNVTEAPQTTVAQPPQLKTTFLDKDCYLISTKDHSDNIKFLVCTDSNKYYLYDSNVASDKALIKITNIKGPNSQKQITITLENQQEPKILTLADSQWVTFPEDVSFKTNCNFGWSEQQPILSCTKSYTTPQKYWWNPTINLTKFNFPQ